MLTIWLLIGGVEAPKVIVHTAESTADGQRIKDGTECQDVIMPSSLARQKYFRLRLVSQPRTMFEVGGVRFPLVSSLRALPPRHPARRKGARSPFELTHSLHNIERCVHGPHPLHVPLTS